MNTQKLLCYPRVTVSREAMEDGSYPVYGTRYIKSVLVQNIESHQTPCEEWECNATIRFNLHKPECFSVFGKLIKIVAVLFHSIEWSDEMTLTYVGQCVDDVCEGNMLLDGIPVAEPLLREIYEVFWLEARAEKGGIFKNHLFDESNPFDDYCDLPSREDIIVNICDEVEGFCRKRRGSDDISENFIMTMVSILTQNGREWNIDFQPLLEKAYETAALKYNTSTVLPPFLHCLRCNNPIMTEDSLLETVVYVDYITGNDIPYRVNNLFVGVPVSVCPHCQSDKYLVKYRQCYTNERKHLPGIRPQSSYTADNWQRCFH